jgi:5-methylcytosine-specific restriction endonuclease McrA
MEYTEKDKGNSSKEAAAIQPGYPLANLGKWAQKGYKWEKPRSPENREKIRNAQLGKKYPEERRRHISEACMGRVPWNKGIPHSEETKRKIGMKSKGRVSPPESIRQGAAKRMGANNPAWKGGVRSQPGYNAFHCHKRRLRKLGAKGSHSLQEWEELKQSLDYICVCCKRQEPEIRLTEDHIIPLSKGGTDDIANLQPLCQSCNSRKHVRTTSFLRKEAA